MVTTPVSVVTYAIIAGDVVTVRPAATLWTGRPYEAEGGLIGTAAFLVGFLATFARARSQHRAALPVTPPQPGS